MSALLWLALALVIVWILGTVVFEVVGFVIHLLLFAAAILLLAWGVRRFQSHREASP